MTKQLTEADFEQQIQEKGLTATRLTPADIDATIVSETYTVLPDGRTTICQLTLRNGFTVDGKAVCVSRENFDEQFAKDKSRQNARNKIWELESYLLHQRLHESKCL